MDRLGGRSGAWGGLVQESAKGAWAKGWAGCGPGAELGFEEATGWFEVEKLLESTDVTFAEAGDPD